jgi:hypothetical protein
MRRTVLHFFVFKNVMSILKYFKTVKERTRKMYDFILKFYNMKFYFDSLIIYWIK